MLRQILVKIEDQRVPFSRRSLIHNVPIWRLTELYRKTLSGRQEFFWGVHDKSPLSRVSRESPRSTSGGPAAHFVPSRPPPVVSPCFSRSVSLQKVTFLDLASFIGFRPHQLESAGLYAPYGPKKHRAHRRPWAPTERGSFVTLCQQLFP